MIHKSSIWGGGICHYIYGQPRPPLGPLTMPGQEVNQYGRLVQQQVTGKTQCA